VVKENEVFGTLSRMEIDALYENGGQITAHVAKKILQKLDAEREANEKLRSENARIRNVRIVRDSEVSQLWDEVKRLKGDLYDLQRVKVKALALIDSLNISDYSILFSSLNEVRQAVRTYEDQRQHRKSYKEDQEQLDLLKQITFTVEDYMSVVTRLLHLLSKNTQVYHIEIKEARDLCQQQGDILEELLKRWHALSKTGSKHGSAHHKT